MRLLLLLFLSILLVDCHCPKCLTVSSVKDSIVERIIPHDTTIYVKGESIVVRDSIPCPALIYHKSVTKNHLTSTIDIKNGVIKGECKEDSLIGVIAHLQDKFWIIDHSQKDVQTNKCKHEATKFDIFCYCMTVASIVGFLIWLYFKIKP